MKHLQLSLFFVLGISPVFSQNQGTFKCGSDNYYQQHLNNHPEIIIEAKEIIGASVGNRAKEGLIIDFINQTNLAEIEDRAIFIDEFYQFCVY